VALVLLRRSRPRPRPGTIPGRPVTAVACLGPAMARVVKDRPPPCRAPAGPWGSAARGHRRPASRHPGFPTS